MSDSKLTHLDAEGAARMVDVSGKPKVRRTARAAGFIRLAPKTLELIRNNRIEKGEVLSTARIAGITGGKRTSDLIPLCHPLPLTRVAVDFEVEADGVRTRATVRTDARTGVEMEALTAASVAALTIYDMCKAIDPDMRVEGVVLLEKTKSEPSGS